ncbi:DMT family transporter, partial [Bacteroidales bacterium]|nr:DMT family transporter [Bacteroidales bacterium]
MIWIFFSMNAALFFGLRYLVIKKSLQKVNTLNIAFVTRLIGFILLLPGLFFVDLPKNIPTIFWLITIATSILTGIASVLQIHAIKKYDLSLSVPFLSFVPLFMLLPVFFVFHEIPTIHSLYGVMLLCIGALFINSGNMGFKKIISGIATNIGGLYFLMVALL